MNVPALSVPCFFATGDTATYPLCVLVPLWVVAGPSYRDSSVPCAIGMRYHTAVPWRSCDMCATPAVAKDENGTLYCHACLVPGGDTYGVVQTRFLQFVEA